MRWMQEHVLACVGIFVGLLGLLGLLGLTEKDWEELQDWVWKGIDFAILLGSQPIQLYDLFFVVVVIRVFLYIKSLYRKQEGLTEPTKPDFCHQYTSDRFLGANWTWGWEYDYRAEKWDVVNLLDSCPSCGHHPLMIPTIREDMGNDNVRRKWVSIRCVCGYKYIDTKKVPNSEALQLGSENTERIPTEIEEEYLKEVELLIEEGSSEKAWKKVVADEISKKADDRTYQNSLASVRGAD